MYRFGPAGNSKSFYDAGYKASAQAPAYIRSMGLNAYEYSAGRGVQLSDETAALIGAEAAANGIFVSIHAPYYINCATIDPESREKSFGYILDSARVVNIMGGDRVIFHPGSEKGGHDEALERAIIFIRECLQRLDDAGLSHIHICPETMGKIHTLGTLDDVIEMCRIDARIIPALDFAHLHARSLGGLDSVQAYYDVMTRLLRGLWPEFDAHAADGRGYDGMPARLKHFHSHFSHVQYIASGERKHVSFADEGYGPDFDQLAVVLRRYKLEPTVICESRDTQIEDARTMQQTMEVNSAAL